jgi:hypothetical protein
MAGRKIKEIKHLIYEDNAGTAFIYEVFIRKHAELGHKIPGRVLRKYFSLFILDPGQDPEIIKASQERAKQILERFPRINYHGKAEIPVIKMRDVDGKFVRVPWPKGQEKGEVVTYNMKDCLESLCKTLQVLSLENKGNLSKDECIQIAYNRLSAFKAEMNQEHQKDFTEFKMGVTASFVAVIFGFQVSNKKLTSQVLFDASRHAIQKAKRASKD